MRFDGTTLAAYRAGSSAAARAQAVRDSLGSGTLTVELRDGETLVYAGTFAGPMTAGGDGSLSADVLLSGVVTTGGTPDAATWMCRIRNADGRYVEGSFGPGGRFTFSGGALVVGQAVRLRVTIAAAGGVEIEPDLVGGTVHQLLAGWSGDGYQLLTTAPSAPTYSPQGHAGSVWDEARQIMWIYGGDTHGSTTGMNNGVYRWDVSDGLFKRQRAPDPFPGEYLVTPDGYLYADAAMTRPWATHSYRQMVWVPETREIMVLADAGDHTNGEGLTPGPTAWTDRKKPIWRFETRTGLWRMEPHTSAARSLITGMTGSSVIYAPGTGYFRINAPWIRKLSEDFQTYQTWNVSGQLSARYHDYGHFVDGLAIKFGGGVSSESRLCSITPVSNPAASYPELLADFAVLSGWSILNNWSALMDDGRILFGVQSEATPYVQAAMIYDPALRTVVDTGHRLPGETSGVTTYTLKAEWSSLHQCAIFVTVRFGGNNRVYAMRP